jgi:hypothetical protein
LAKTVQQPCCDISFPHCYKNHVQLNNMYQQNDGGCG